jgi:uncharacterized protein
VGEFNNQEEASDIEKTWGMLSHIGAFLGFFLPLGHILVPLIIFFVKKDASEFILNHSKESLNFQISITIYFIIAGILTIVLIGFLFLLALLAIEIIFVILASMKANNGEMYKYPLSIRFVK